jgi:hypothetical protein
LREQNYEVRSLGLAEGLGTDVPSDAGAVVIIGPSKPFLPEEIQSIHRFLDRGGKLFVALDPEAGLDFADLLAPLGLKLGTTVLANDQVYAAVSRQKMDRANIVVVPASSHPSITTLGQAGRRGAFPVFRAGTWQENNRKPDTTIDYTLEATQETWPDANNNLEPDKDEVRRQYPVAASVSRKNPAGKRPADDMRAVLLADADVLTDAYLVRLPPAVVFAMDGLKWLVGDEAIAGETTSEKDVPIAHTRKQDTVWFYSTIFLAPLVVLGVGFFATRRRARKRRGPPLAAAGQPKEVAS